MIKLMITGGVLDAKAKGEPGELKMPADVRAACDEAHRAGLRLQPTLKAPKASDVPLNGVDTIEHGAVPDQEIIELFKRGAHAR